MEEDWAVIQVVVGAGQSDVQGEVRASVEALVAGAAWARLGLFFWIIACEVTTSKNLSGQLE